MCKCGVELSGSGGLVEGCGEQTMNLRAPYSSPAIHLSASEGICSVQLFSSVNIRKN